MAPALTTAFLLHQFSLIVVIGNEYEVCLRTKEDV
jgi:hypothetical protein